MYIKQVQQADLEQHLLLCSSHLPWCCTKLKLLTLAMLAAGHH
jgi:hypothetical protein